MQEVPKQVTAVLTASPPPASITLTCRHKDTGAQWQVKAKAMPQDASVYNLEAWCGDKREFATYVTREIVQESVIYMLTRIGEGGNLADEMEKWWWSAGVRGQC